jgi:hypothetical protein
LPGAGDEELTDPELLAARIDELAGTGPPNPSLLPRALDAATLTWSGPLDGATPEDVTRLRAAAASSTPPLVEDPFAARIIERAQLVDADIAHTCRSLAEIATAEAALGRGAATSRR